MTNIDLYQAIFKRKSIRKYDLSALEEDVLLEVFDYVSKLQPIDESIKTEMQFVSHKDIHNFLPIKAPHYVVAFSERKEGYLTNIGFMLQQMDLFLSSKGIGSCWQGIPRPTAKVIQSSSLEFIIVMAFGRTHEPLYRNSINDFKRKPVNQIGTLMENRLIEAIRLAPSATNSQPWFFWGNGHVIHAYCVKTSYLKALIYKKMNQIDMGIALCHLWLAAQYSGRKVTFYLSEDGLNNPPPGYYYIASAVLE